MKGIELVRITLEELNRPIKRKRGWYPDSLGILMTYQFEDTDNYEIPSSTK